MRALVIEDVRVSRETLAAMLRMAFAGATVYCESDLTGAFMWARQFGELDLVLLDLGLPDSAGIETLRHFREQFPQTKVIVVSIEEDPVLMREAIRCGANGFILKSTEPSVIVKALQLVYAGGTYVPVEALEKMA